MEKLITQEIMNFVLESHENRFPGSSSAYFESPLVGFASAEDPIFADFRRIIGPFHQGPREILESARSVIVWVLPVTQATRESNRRETEWPSLEWALTRNNGENLNSALRRHIAAWLESRGYRALPPQLAPGWRQLEDPVAGIASTWSERHAAYAAGLGSFSLNDGLITAAGIAHRLGSVVTDLSLIPTPRTLPDYRHNCLWYREQSCGACIGRCPVGAISKEGHDKEKCRDYVYGAIPRAVGERYAVAQTGCGLCQTKVPCEALVPRGIAAGRL